MNHKITEANQQYTAFKTVENAFKIGSYIWIKGICDCGCDSYLGRVTSASEVQILEAESRKQNK